VIGECGFCELIFHISFPALASTACRGGPPSFFRSPA
jgi:hypothetical protein